MSTVVPPARIPAGAAALPPMPSSVAPPPSTTQTTHPLLGIFAVLLGAIVTTLSSRATSVGLADLRGAIGAGFDDGAWITTSFTVAQMLIGPLAVWIARVGSNRRVLLLGATLFCLSELLIPFSPNLPVLLMLQFLAGLGSGVFIPVTIGFITLNLPRKYWTFGLSAYAMSLELSLNLAATLEGWYDRYFDWRWLFWQNAALAAAMIVLIWGGMPSAPFNRDEARRGDFLGMALAPLGFALLFAALDQGDRLNWLNSDLITSLAIGGMLCIAAFFFHEAHTRRPGIDLSLLARRNMLQILILIAIARFLITGSGFLVPQFLIQVAGHRPFQFGDALLWVALPQVLIAPLVAALLLRVDPRALAAFGLIVVALAFLQGQRMTSAWHEPDFVASQLTQAVGQTMCLTSLIFLAVQHFRPQDAMSFGAFLQTARLFGGQLGTTAIQVFARQAEHTDSQLLGSHVGAFDPETLDRLHALATGLAAHLQGSGAADNGAVLLLDCSVRAQAYTLAYADGMALCAGVAIAALLLVLSLRKPP
jgi:DHA2 family multidrug resistance protein